MFLRRMAMKPHPKNQIGRGHPDCNGTESKDAAHALCSGNPNGEPNSPRSAFTYRTAARGHALPARDRKVISSSRKVLQNTERDHVDPMPYKRMPSGGKRISGASYTNPGTHTCIASLSQCTYEMSLIAHQVHNPEADHAIANLILDPIDVKCKWHCNRRLRPSDSRVLLITRRKLCNCLSELGVPFCGGCNLLFNRKLRRQASDLPGSAHPIRTRIYWYIDNPKTRIPSTLANRPVEVRRVMSGKAITRRLREFLEAAASCGPSQICPVCQKWQEPAALILLRNFESTISSNSMAAAFRGVASSSLESDMPL